MSTISEQPKKAEKKTAKTGKLELRFAANGVLSLPDGTVKRFKSGDVVSIPNKYFSSLSGSRGFECHVVDDEAKEIKAWSKIEKSKDLKTALKEEI